MRMNVASLPFERTIVTNVESEKRDKSPPFFSLFNFAFDCLAVLFTRGHADVNCLYSGRCVCGCVLFLHLFSPPLSLSPTKEAEPQNIEHISICIHHTIANVLHNFGWHRAHYEKYYKNNNTESKRHTMT